MIAVTTSKRANGTSYLAATLAEIDRSATGRRFVVSDRAEHAPEVPKPWALLSFNRPQTDRPCNKFSVWRAMELADAAAEDLLVFEDDVTLCTRAAQYMEGFAVPGDVDLVSFYDPYGDGRRPDGLWRSKMHVFMFAQAFKLPLRSVRDALRTRVEDIRGNVADDAMQEIGEARRWTYAIHSPGLVQHVGEVSAIGNPGMDGGRTSKSFRGRDWNAMSLRHHLFD